MTTTERGDVMETLKAMGIRFTQSQLERICVAFSWDEIPADSHVGESIIQLFAMQKATLDWDQLDPLAHEKLLDALILQCDIWYFG